MKILKIIFFIIFIPFFVKAQVINTVITQNPNTITVTGYTEISLIPDYFLCELQLSEEIEENYKDNRSTKTVTRVLDSVEFDLIQFLVKNNIDTNKLEIINYGIDPYFNNNRVSEFVLLTVRKTNDIKKILIQYPNKNIKVVKIIKKFEIKEDSVATEMFIKAISNARTKAEKVAASEKRSVGLVLSIVESVYKLGINNDHRFIMDSFIEQSNTLKGFSETFNAHLQVTFELK
jgi:uncharacterized protein YggE